MNSWRIWHNDICLLLHVNEFFSYMIPIHLMRQAPKWLRNECVWIFFYCVLPFLLVYLNFIWKLCTWDCMLNVFIRGMNFLNEFSCEMLKGSSDEHQSTTLMAFLFSTCFHTSIESHFCACILKVKTDFFLDKVKIIDK